MPASSFQALPSAYCQPETSCGGRPSCGLELCRTPTFLTMSVSRFAKHQKPPSPLLYSTPVPLTWCQTASPRSTRPCCLVYSPWRPGFGRHTSQRRSGAFAARFRASASCSASLFSPSSCLAVTMIEGSACHLSSWKYCHCFMSCGCLPLCCTVEAMTPPFSAMPASPSAMNQRPLAVLKRVPFPPTCRQTGCPRSARPGCFRNSPCSEAYGGATIQRRSPSAQALRDASCSSSACWNSSRQAVTRMDSSKRQVHQSWYCHCAISCGARPRCGTADWT
mmetsp:Transcript_130685/g.364127  ORF Transcript_130685/g.364127 Transcript_130685/m.364127 type:complete len:278 (-) Transcript_130685:280-1113(-)